MNAPQKLMMCALVASSTLSVMVYAAQTLDVKIIDRQDRTTEYTYVVPGQANLNSSTSTNCIGNGDSVNCQGSSNTTGTITPARAGSYQVRGATLALLLPDGRVVVVNCESRYALHMDFVNRRSCRVPLVETIQAEFDGDKARLTWSVSIDGTKTQSEKYKILGVFDKQ